MDINDFKGLTKFKVFLPIVYIISWILMIFGPVFFIHIYQRICLFFIIYLDLKVFALVITMAIVTVKSHSILKRVQLQDLPTEQNNHEYMNPTQQINYGFIIPNYKEQVEMIAETLDVLASHKRAKQRYLIFLAMEDHEDGCEMKALQLISNFKSKFKLIDFTQHKVLQFQSKGKASNVSWCAEHLEPILSRNIINPESLFLTIMDADSWAPDVYFDLMEEHIVKNFQMRHNYIFQPPQIFTRNNIDVPVFTRVYDLMHSFVHCSNLFSIFKITFPLSNYTLSYQLVKRIGFWDTCLDAIGEDFHTTQKAYWKTGGQIIAVPIYAPFNQINIATERGYIEDVKARFWQAERHAEGCADLAYEFKMLFSHKFRLLNLVIFYITFEIFTLPAIVPWIFISLGLQELFLEKGDYPEGLIPPGVINILFNIMAIGSFVGYLLFEVFKRRSNRIMYKRNNESLLRILQYLILFPVNLFTISIPTFTIGAFKVLFGNREYVVAEKKGAIKGQKKLQILDNI